MSDNLPVPHTGEVANRVDTYDQSRQGSVLREWIGSPLGRAVAQVLPDVLRIANRPRPDEPRSFMSNVLPRSDGASGVTLSEVDLDVNIPFVRRITVRSASSWSVAPDVVLAQQRQKQRSRWKLRALAAGAVGVAGLILARRGGVSLPARIDPLAGLPFVSSATSVPDSSTGQKEPGAAE